MYDINCLWWMYKFCHLICEETVHFWKKEFEGFGQADEFIELVDYLVHRGIFLYVLIVIRQPICSRWRFKGLVSSWKGKLRFLPFQGSVSFTLKDWPDLVRTDILPLPSYTLFQRSEQLWVIFSLCLSSVWLHPVHLAWPRINSYTSLLHGKLTILKSR